MKVIVFQDEAYREMLKELKRVVQEAVDNATPKKKEKDWLNEEEAKMLLGFRSKSKMQKMRDNREIVFTQHGRTIMYSRKSIVEFMNQNIPKY